MKKKGIIALSIVVIGFLLIKIFLLKESIPLKILKEKYTEESSHFVPLNGLDVHYKEMGEGVPIILIHGTSASLHTWSTWQEELSKNYKVFSIDMQGGGLTTPPEDDIYSIQSYIDLIDAFVTYQDLDSFYLAGNSLGGHTAWAYASQSKYAAKVKKLILIDPSGFHLEDADRPLVFQLAQYDFLFDIIEQINVAPFVQKSVKEVYGNDDLIDDEILTQYTDLMHRAGNRKAFFLKVRQLETGKIEDLQKITCPTLILWGEKDIWIPLELAEIFTENISNNQLITYPECGHIPMEENPSETVEDVLHFFKTK